MITLTKVAPLLQCYSCLAIKCALLLTVLGCISPVPLQLNTNCMKFRTIKNIPVLEGKLNGKRALFIIDTGASVSILNKSESQKFGFRFIDSAGDQVAGLGGGRSPMNKAVNCEVQ